MHEQDWNQLILQYLKQKGFSEAEQAFSKSVGTAAAKDEMALAHRFETHRGVIENLVSNFAAEGDPQFYGEAFDRLAAWVDNSLDIYRGELGRVLYPIFLHTYLELISRDATAAASTLLHKHRRRMADAPGAGRSSRAQQLQELQGLVGRQQLETHRLAKQLKSAKHTLRMSAYCHDLLMHFLHTTPRLLPMSAIVSQHVVFELSEGLPGGAEDEGPGQEGDDGAGADDLDAHATNQAAVQLGLLKGNIEDLFEEEKAKAAAPQQQQQQAAAGAEGAAGDTQGADGAGPSTGDGAGTSAAAAAPGAGQAAEGQAAGAAAAAAAGALPSAEPPVKKSKKDKAGGAGQAAAAAAAAAAAKKKERPERVNPEPFVPPLGDELTAAWLQDVEHRAEVGPSLLPSCCFFTFVNTRQSLTCAAFARDASRVAAGFADSSIRLYDVQQLSRNRQQKQQQQQQQDAAAPSPGPTSMDIDEDEDAYGTPRQQPATSTSTSGLPPPHPVLHLHGHTAPVYAVDFSHDTRLLFSGSGDGTVRLWSPELGAGLAALKGHMLPIWDVAACPQGWLLASASADRTARIWASDSIRPLRILAGHQSDVNVVRWHPNCHYVATASSDRTVRLWDVASGECVRVMGGLRTSCPTSLAVSPDGRQVVCGTDEGSMHVWDLGSAKRVATLQGHVGPVWSVAYSSGSGALLASGGADETVRLWANDVTGDGAVPADGSAAAAAAATSAAAAAGRSGKAGQQLLAGSSTAPTCYCPLNAYRTKSSPAMAVQFTARNLLLAAGAFNLRSSDPRRQRQPPRQ